MTDDASDRTAEGICTAFTHALERHGEVVETDLTALDRTGLPVSGASLLAGGALTHHGNGYGATTAWARVGGLGELVERVVGAAGVARLRQEAVHGSRRELVATHGEDGVVDPRLLALPSGADWSEDRPLTWVTTHEVRSGRPVLVPLELVASDGRELGEVPEPLLPPVTNGLGAGLDPDRAVAHGLGEVLQRHTNGLRFRALDRLSRAVDETGLPDDVASLVARLRSAGVEPVLRHAVTELGVASTYVVGADASLDHPDKIVVTACGEAADPDPAASLTKALLEFAHSRARKAFCFGDQGRALAVAPPAYRDHLVPVVGDERAAAALRRWRDLPAADLARLVGAVPAECAGTVPFAALQPDGDGPAGEAPADRLAHLLDRLSGHDVLAAVTEQDGVVVAKVLVTGLEVETLSHGRIGEAGARFSLAHDLDLVRVADGPDGEHAARVHLTPDAEERLGGPVWFAPAVAARIVGDQYPQYREPGRHSVVV